MTLGQKVWLSLAAGLSTAALVLCGVALEREDIRAAFLALLFASASMAMMFDRRPDQRV